MVKWNKWTSTLALLMSPIALGCSGGMNELEGDEWDASEEIAAEGDDLGTAEQGWWYYYPPPPTGSSGGCNNPDGTNSTMAALAVAAAKELGRWQVGKDFVIARTNGWTENSWGNVEALKLASGSDFSGQPIGKNRCAGGSCPNVQALLDMQYDQARDQIYLQGSGTNKVLLNPEALRSRTIAKWKEQKSCDDAARDGDYSACPREEHALTFLSAEKGSCDTNFYFQAVRPNGSALSYVSQLRHKLRFADASNPYISFQDLGGGKISIDPTSGLNEDGSTTSGSCPAVCTKVSSSNVAGTCCTCGGSTKKLVKSTFSSAVYTCK